MYALHLFDLKKSGLFGFPPTPTGILNSMIQFQSFFSQEVSAEQKFSFNLGMQIIIIFLSCSQQGSCLRFVDS